MKIYISDTDNPFFNLAFEEWAVKNYDTSNEDLMILYINKPCVVVGRNQNIFEEVNVKYCTDNNIEICRRVSGGGTVFHDYGNLNWSIITKNDVKKINRYDFFNKYIFNFLKSYHINVYSNSRNSLEVNGYKICGQAQFTNKKNMISHGTLLVNTNFSKMQPAIEPSNEFNVFSIASKSVRSQVINLSEINPTFKNVELVMKLFVEFLNFNLFDCSEYIINEAAIIQDKYKSYQWVFEKSPKFEIHFKTEDITLQINKGVVTKVINKKGQVLNTHPYLFVKLIDILI